MKSPIKNNSQKGLVNELCGRNALQKSRNDCHVDGDAFVSNIRTRRIGGTTFFVDSLYIIYLPGLLMTAVCVKAGQKKTR
jgi:hypothetical protein